MQNIMGFHKHLSMSFAVSQCSVNLQAFRRSFPQFLTSIRSGKWRASVHNHFISYSGPHVCYNVTQSIFTQTLAWLFVHGSHATFDSVTLPKKRLPRWSMLGRINLNFCFLEKQVYKIRFPCDHRSSAVCKITPRMYGFYFINPYEFRVFLGKAAYIKVIFVTTDLLF